MQRPVNRPRCVVNGCQNNKRLLSAENYTGVAWFPFPRQNAPLMKKWKTALQKVNEWYPATNDVICVAHFVPKDIASSPYGRPKTLKPEAVPSVFDMCVKTTDPYDVGPDLLPTIRLQRIDEVLEIINQRVKLRPTVYTGKAGGSRPTPSRKRASRPTSHRRPRPKRPRVLLPSQESDEDLMNSFPEVEVLLEEPPSPVRPPSLVSASQIKIKLPASVLDSPKQLFVRRQDLPKDLRHSVTSNKKLWIKTSGPNARHLMVNVVDDVPQGAKTAISSSEPQPSVSTCSSSSSPAVEVPQQQGTSGAEGRVPPLVTFPPPDVQPLPTMMFLDHATFGHKIRPFTHNTSTAPPVSVIPSAGQPRMVFANSETAKTFLSRALQGVKAADLPTDGEVIEDEARETVEHDHEYSQYSSIRFSRGNVLRLERQVADLTKTLTKTRSELQLLKLNHEFLSLDPAPPPPQPAAPIVTIPRPDNWMKISRPAVWTLAPPPPLRSLLTAPTRPAPATWTTAQRAVVSRPQKTAARTQAARTEDDFEEMMPRFEQVNVPDDFGHHFMAGWMESGDIIESA